MKGVYMSKKEIIGIEPVSYQRDGRDFFGVRLYISSPLPSPGVGNKVQIEYIANTQLSDFHLGPIAAVLYEPGFKSGTYRPVGILYANK